MGWTKADETDVRSPKSRLGALPGPIYLKTFLLHMYNHNYVRG